MPSQTWYCAIPSNVLAAATGALHVSLPYPEPTTKQLPAALTEQVPAPAADTDIRPCSEPAPAC